MKALRKSGKEAQPVILKLRELEKTLSDPIEETLLRSRIAGLEVFRAGNGCVIPLGSDECIAEYIDFVKADIREDALVEKARAASVDRKIAAMRIVSKIKVHERDLPTDWTFDAKLCAIRVSPDPRKREKLERAALREASSIRNASETVMREYAARQFPRRVRNCISDAEPSLGEFLGDLGEALAEDKRTRELCRNILEDRCFALDVLAKSAPPVVQFLATLAVKYGATSEPKAKPPIGFQREERP